MPSNKILTVLIVCFGVVTSIYLFERTADSPVKNNPAITKNIDAVPVNSLDNNQSDDWKKILVSVDSKSQTTSVLTNPNPEVFDGTTLTAQISRDLFSRYLLIANKPGGITTDDANKIVNNVLVTPEYTKATGPVYTEVNLNINTNKDLDTLKNYKNVLDQTWRKIITEIKEKDDPINIVNKALKNESQNELVKLDSIVKSGKSIVNDLIKMDVPENMVVMHLNLLNASGNLLSNLEAMREILIDPVRGLSGLSQYPKHMADLQIAFLNINSYLNQKLGINL